MKNSQTYKQPRYGPVYGVIFLALILHILMGLRGNALAQSYLDFDNNPVIPVVYENSRTPVGPEVTVGLYYSDDVNASVDELILGATTRVIISGRFDGTPVLVPLGAGTNVRIEIRAWTVMLHMKRH